MNIYNNFTNLFQLNKSLRFELIPVGKTKEYLDKENRFSTGGPLEKDKIRADKYKEARAFLDSKHKAFIEKTLANFHFPESMLEEYDLLYNDAKSKTRGSDAYKKLVGVQKNMRKSISEAFTKNSEEKKITNKEYSYLFHKDIINEYLAKHEGMEGCKVNCVMQ